MNKITHFSTKKDKKDDTQHQTKQRKRQNHTLSLSLSLSEPVFFLII
jgi:hypothetical protein